ncbi:hypothetical protein ILS25_06925 [Leuconostoc suionicum]|uniref:hypothetical protein n=1 Tax=Leuconostoc suionicum TaxID=1511761 RepID=UPI00186B5DB5|nr:hypothetical protein [Leuconostoc suionicum]MBE4728080.1 hypothetical protein [Leuconostoc suionicum]
MKTSDPVQYAGKVLNASMDGFQTAFFVSLIFAVIGFVFGFFMKNGQEGRKVR